MRPHRTILVLEDLFSKRRGVRLRNGSPLTLEDSATVDEVYQQWLLLLSDYSYFSFDTDLNILGRIIFDLTKKDVLDVLNACAEAVDKLRRRSTTGFKALLSRISSHLYPLLKRDITSCGECCVLAARKLNCVFSYMGRLTLRDIDLMDECLEAYREVEENFDLRYPRGFTNKLNAIIARWFKSIDVEELDFKHGPGGVAGHGRTTIETKYRSLYSDPLIRYTFPDYVPLSTPIKSAPDRISQTIFVPKSYKAFRTISMEPATLMYLQQGIWGAIDNHVHKNPYLRNRIGFHEQRRNQVLAQRGSIERSYATIDLSAASDSVSYELVKRLFRSTPLLRLIVATRSTKTLLPDGTLLPLRKFAPMGSALCFPIETIIFAAVCEFVTRERAHMDRNRGFIGDFSVFGDDIIVPTDVAQDVVYYLELLGFSCNPTKSFLDPTCWFRESCGGEYVDGFDITPIRVSRKYYAILDDRGITGCIDLANQCLDRGLRNLRAFFLSKIKAHKISRSVRKGSKLFEIQTDYRPLFAPYALKALTYTNFHTNITYDLGLQTFKIKSHQLVSKTNRGDEEIALRYWLESCRKREVLIDAFIANIGSATTSMKLVSRVWNADPSAFLGSAFVNAEIRDSSASFDGVCRTPSSYR